MPALTIQAVLAAVIQYGPTIIPLIQKLVADIEAGKANKVVTAQDLAELDALASQSAADIYRRLGITPPPAA